MHLWVSWPTSTNVLVTLPASWPCPMFFINCLSSFVFPPYFHCYNTTELPPQLMRESIFRAVTNIHNRNHCLPGKTKRNNQGVARRRRKGKREEKESGKIEKVKRKQKWTLWKKVSERREQRREERWLKRGDLKETVRCSQINLFEKFTWLEWKISAMLFWLSIRVLLFYTHKNFKNRASIKI